MIDTAGGMAAKVQRRDLSSSFWSTTGNTGTSTSANFFGTLDAVDLRFGRNNTEIARLTSNGFSIGTTSTAGKINISYSNNTGANSGIRVTNTSTGTSTYTPLELVNNASVLSQIFLVGGNWAAGNGVRASGAGWNNNGAGGLTFSANNNSAIINFVNTTSYTERMRIDEVGGVSIGSAANANTSSILDLTSTSKGFLMPRGTSAQRTAISSPANGLQFYDTDSAAIFVYNGAWVGLGLAANANNTLTGADVTMTTLSTWYTGATVVLGVGTWLLTGTISMTGTVSAIHQYTSRIFDGTNAVASGHAIAANTGSRVASLAMSTIVTITSGTKTYNLQGASNQNSSAIAYQTSTLTQPGATQISAVKIR
jgi:hypothetical protein